MPAPVASRHAPGRGWSLVFAGLDCEVLVGGGADRPDPARVEQACWAVEHLDALAARAREYLAAFVAPARLADGVEAIGVELGWRGEGRPDELHLVLLPGGDEPAEWRVRIRRAPLTPGGFYPYGFSYLPI